MTDPVFDAGGKNLLIIDICLLAHHPATIQFVVNTGGINLFFYFL